MKLATYVTAQGRDAVAALGAGGDLVDLQAAHTARHGSPLPAFAGMIELIEGWDEARGVAADLIARPPAEALRPRVGTQLKAPLPRPVQIRDFVSFETHFRQARAAIQRLWPTPGMTLLAADAPLPELFYRQPVYYKANRLSVCGPEATVYWPAYSEVMDYELELAMVIGVGGRDIPASRARRHIFGFTVFNDFSARDAQQVEMPGSLGPAKGKDFDNGNALGPYIVTLDEIADPYRLTMTARVNGEVWSSGSTADMHWSFEDMIAHVSRSETLHPGEVFGSGTVGGGCGLELGRFLADGDVVELEIEGLGVLRNRVVRSSEPAA